MKASKALWMMCVIGCGGGDDAAPPGDDDPGDVEVITVEVTGQPALVAYRDDASPTWQTPSVDGVRSFAATVHGPYRVVVVCADEQSVAASQYARTPADGAVLRHLCGTADFPLAVRGRATEPVQLTLGLVGYQLAQAPADFALPAVAGTYDLGMLFGPLDAPDRLAVRRDLDVTADVTLAPIDARSAGAEALVPMTFTASNGLPDEELTQRTQLHTAHAAITLRETHGAPNDGWDTALVAAAALQPTDHQTIALTATRQLPAHRTTSRTLAREVHAGDSAEVKLPEPAPAIAFDMTASRLGAPLAQLPAHSDVAIWQLNLTAGDASWLHETRLSASFLDATHADTAVVDFSAVPGFQPGWRLQPGLDMVRALDATQPLSTYAYTATRVRDVLRASDR